MDERLGKGLPISRRQIIVGGSIGVGVVALHSVLGPRPAVAAGPEWVKPLDRPITYTQDWEGNGRFKYDPDGKHRALDMARYGYSNSPVYSMAAGTVVQSGWREYLGYCVTIRHVDDYYTMYAHLKYDPPAPVGSIIAAGQQIGVMGKTGGDWPVHLHLEMYRGGWARHPTGGDRINPESIVRNAPYRDQAPPPGEEMPDYVIHMRTISQALPTAFSIVRINDENNVSVQIGGLISVVTNIEVSGLAVGEVMQARYVTTTDGGTANLTTLGAVEIAGTSGNTYGQIAAVVDLGDRFLRLQMSGPSGATILNLKTRGIAWS
jgi:hypothetical protein